MPQREEAPRTFQELLEHAVTALEEIADYAFEGRCALGQLEEWRCGTCSYHEKAPYDDRDDVGACLNAEAMERINTFSTGPIDGHSFTSDDFGCRFWARKPLEPQAS